VKEGKDTGEETRIAGGDDLAGVEAGGVEIVKVDEGTAKGEQPRQGEVGLDDDVLLGSGEGAGNFAIPNIAHGVEHVGLLRLGGESGVEGRGGGRYGLWLLGRSKGRDAEGREKEESGE